MAIADSIVMELDQEAKTTQRVLERIPEDKLSWKPHPKSYSLGQLGLHIARAQGGLAEAISKDAIEVPNFTQPEAATRKEILDTLTKSTADA
ncbi:MAG TPA: DinB family protein, partial [Candidatus Acidoferrales bacterium]